MSVHVQPLTSKCGHTLEILLSLSTLFPVERSANFAFTLKFLSYLKNISQGHFWPCNHVTLMPKLRSLSSKLVL